MAFLVRRKIGSVGIEDDVRLLLRCRERLLQRILAVPKQELVQPAPRQIVVISRRVSLLGKIEKVVDNLAENLFRMRKGGVIVYSFVRIVRAVYVSHPRSLPLHLSMQ